MQPVTKPADRAIDLMNWYNARFCALMTSGENLLREWLEAIRHGGTPSGNIKTAYEDAITCLMATQFYCEQRRVVYDARREKVL